MLQQLEKYRVPEDDFVGSRLINACNQIIDSWVALKLAFQNNTQTIQESPQNIKKLLAYQLAAYIYNCETEIEDIVEFLSIYLEKFLQLIIEDHSDQYIAKRILEVAEDLEKNNEGKYLQLLEDIKVYNQQNSHLNHVINNNDSDDDDDDDDNQDNNQEEPPQLVQQQQQQQQAMEEEDEPDVDSDGFEIVKPKRRYKKN